MDKNQKVFNEVATHLAMERLKNALLIDVLEKIAKAKNSNGPRFQKMAKIILKDIGKFT